MILCCGEALIDFVPLGGDLPGYRPCPGGSPYNVAVGLGRLQIPVAYFAKISTDFFGDQLVSYLEENGVDTTWILRAAGPTTLAFVSLPDKADPIEAPRDPQGRTGGHRAHARGACSYRSSAGAGSRAARGPDRRISVKRRPSSSSTFAARVLAVVRRIPRGSVATYGEVARLAGRPRAARAVGNIMRDCHLPDVPCHRVIAAGGRLGGFGGSEAVKRALLVAEGVPMAGSRVKRPRSRRSV